MKKYREWIFENERVDHRDLLTQEQLEWCKKNILQEWWVNEKGEVEVAKHLNLESNDIKEFPVQFADVKGGFSCYGCKNLTSLKGSPKRVGEDFDCDDCKSLTSLEGAPEEVGGDFYCQRCDLTTLEGLPKKFKILIPYSNPKLPQIEQDFVQDDDLHEEWKKSPLNWKQFIYGGAAKGRKFGL